MQDATRNRHIFEVPRRIFLVYLPGHNQQLSITDTVFVVISMFVETSSCCLLEQFLKSFSLIILEYCWLSFIQNPASTGCFEEQNTPCSTPVSYYSLLIINITSTAFVITFRMIPTLLDLTSFIASLVNDTLCCLNFKLLVLCIYD